MQFWCIESPIGHLTSFTKFWLFVPFEKYIYRNGTRKNLIMVRCYRHLSASKMRGAREVGVPQICQTIKSAPLANVWGTLQKWGTHFIPTFLQQFSWNFARRSFLCQSSFVHFEFHFNMPGIFSHVGSEQIRSGNLECASHVNVPLS